MQPSLSLRNITYTLQTQKILQDISFELKRGDLLLVQGENGSGKSSLLKIIAGTFSPDSGNISWQNGKLYPNYLHYIGHANGLKLALTVGENMELFATLQNVSLDKENQETIMQKWNLENKIHTQAKCLSAGIRRRLALSRLSLSIKPLWLLDEPLAALDIQSQNIFLTQLKNHLNEGGIVIMTNHQPVNFAIPIIHLKLRP